MSNINSNGKEIQEAKMYHSAKKEILLWMTMQTCK